MDFDVEKIGKKKIVIVYLSHKDVEVLRQNKFVRCSGKTVVVDIHNDLGQ